MLCMSLFLNIIGYITLKYCMYAVHLNRLGLHQEPTEKKRETKTWEMLTMRNVPCAQLTMCKTSQSRQTSIHNL